MAAAAAQLLSTQHLQLGRDCVSQPVTTQRDAAGLDHPQHSRPRMLRRETSQILAYYHSADAGQSETETNYRYPTPNPEPVSQAKSRYHRNTAKTRYRKSRDPCASWFSSSSSSSSYLDLEGQDVDSDTASLSLEAESVNEMCKNKNMGVGWNGDKSWDSNRNEEVGAGGQRQARYIDIDTDTEVQYGIAISSPVEDVIPHRLTTATNGTETEMEMEILGTRPSKNTGTSTGSVDSPGFGNTINSSQNHFHSFSRSQLSHHPTAAHRSLPQTQAAEQVQTVYTHPSQPKSPPLAAALDSVDSSTVGVEPDAAPGRRRQSSTRGASDKRRVAIVQMDTEFEPEREQQSREGERSSGRVAGTVSDGFSRTGDTGFSTVDFHGQRQQQEQGQPQQRLFSVQSPTSSSPSRKRIAPSSGAGSKSTAASALLARRGIVGTFALVGPADASPGAYSNLSYFTPPLSAPAHPTPPLLARHASADSSTSVYSNTSGSSYTSARRQHQRSHSEALLTKPSTPHGSISRSITIADAGANFADSWSKGEKRRPGHRLRKSSRDIGIVGATNASISPTTGTMMTDMQPRYEEAKSRPAAPLETSPHHSAQLSPIFQTPSRSQTSLISSDAASSTSAIESSSTPPELNRGSQQQQHKSEVSAVGNGNIGETNSSALRSARDVNKISVASGSDSRQAWYAPSIASNATYPTYYTPSGAASTAYSYCSMATTVASSSVSSTPAILTMPAAAPSPYLYYQPGLHATAGPLPSPPRQIIPPKRDSPPPPRPPRLHAPNSGSSSLAKRRSDTSVTSKQEQSSPVVKPEVTSPSMTPAATSSTLVNSQSKDSMKNKGHTREGAFPTNSVITTDSMQSRLSVKQDQQDQQPALKRKTTMDELVRDVTAAIDEAAGNAQTTVSVSQPMGNSSVHKNEEQVEPQEPTTQQRRTAIELKREESRSTFKGQESRGPDSPSSVYSDENRENGKSITASKPLPDPHTSSPQLSTRTESQESSGPSKPQKILDLALKRFSALPRPPSRLSVTQSSPRSSISHGRRSNERSDNGHGYRQEQQAKGLTVDQQLPASHKKVVYAPKIRSMWPEAMQFGDVLAERSCLERGLGYARKINELANHDSGLGEWVMTTKHNLTVPGKGSKRKLLSPGTARSPSGHSVTFHPRHSSQGSIGSEMTFPKRVDAYVATDLLPQRSDDEALPRGPPLTLPYPTLAQNPPASQQQQTARLMGSNSTRSTASALGPSKSTSGAGGFFASIGRKASIRKDKPTIQVPGAMQPNKLLSKRQQAIPTPAPRPVQITAQPSLPGGPRAPPGRVQRAQSVITPKMLAQSESESEGKRRRSIKRSPSVAPASQQKCDTLNQGTVSVADIEAKVSKLADLLPHADRKILAGYLRRAGGLDMVAIGKFLDDEKNGVLIRD